MTTQDSGLVAFEADGETLTVRDAVMEASCAFTGSGSLDPVRVSTSRFLFPVDAAVSVEPESLSLPENAGIYVRAEDGEMLEFPSESATTYPRGTYYVEINSYCKFYLKVFDTGFDISMERHNGSDAALIEFEEPASIAVGARSLHEKPAGTITVPDEPSALREALPYLASGVKEWSCERSWPTLRGHPPRLERGDTLDVPDHLSKPETGVTLAVPETYAALYTVAPLAYYLGADVVAAEEPELRLDTGYAEPLARHGDALADATRSLLRHCLFLDSLVRTEGYVSVPIQEYEAVAGELPFYPPELYERTIPEQLMEYLEVDDDVPERHLSWWPYDAVLRDDPADAALLPYLLDFPTPIRVGAAEMGDEAVCAGYSDTPTPTGATRLSVAGFEHSLANPPRPTSEVRVALLGVGDAAVDALSAVSIGEQLSEDEPFELESGAATRSTVREALSDDYTFVHVGAPLTDAGFACADGALEPSELDGVSARAVSVLGDPGTAAIEALVERGAQSALVASALPDRTLGRIVGRVLSGAPLARAVQWSGLDDGTPYRFSGSTASPLASRDGGAGVTEFAVESNSRDEHRLSASTWGGPSDGRIGGVSGIEAPNVLDEYRLTGQRVEQPGALTSEEVVELVRDCDGVYVLNGEVYQHERELTVADVRESARRALTDAERSEQRD